MRRWKAGFTVAAVLSFLTALAFAAPAMKAPPAKIAAPSPEPFAHEHFHINDADPESSIPSPALQNASPMEFGYFLQELLDKAAATAKGENYPAAIRYYRAVVKAVPDRAVGYARLCKVLEATNQREQALEACRSALGLPGVVVDDYVRFVHLVLAAPGSLSDKDLEDVKAVVAHLRDDKETRIAGLHLQCELGTRLADAATLEECTTALAALAPRDPKTLSFQWALALQKGDEPGARALIRRAQESGMTAEAVAVMKDRTAAVFPGVLRHFADWRFLLPFAVALAAGWATLMTIARRRRQRVA